MQRGRARAWWRAGAALLAAVGVCSSSAAHADEPPAAAPSDALWYVRVGYGAVLARRLTTGPATGIGWRYVPEHLGLDLSAFNFVYTTRDGGFDNVSGSFVKAAALYEVSPRAQGSLFVALGVGWGTAGATASGTSYRGSGLDLGVSAGYGRWVSPAVRLLLQLDATFPAYGSDASLLDSDGMTLVVRRDTLYTPSFALAFGVGFGSHQPTP
jgi:hypothetical protein